jgi:hypothetical protein
MDDKQLQSAFADFLKTLTPEQKATIQGFVPDEATLARESAFSKYQQVQNATNHCALLGGSARADALKAWHKLMGEFSDLMGGLEKHPVEEPKQAVDTTAPNA